MNRQEQLIEYLQGRIQELLVINEEHRKLNGTLREDMKGVVRVLEAIDFSECDGLYDQLPWELLESCR